MSSPIRDYLNSVSDMMASAAVVAGSGTHRGDIGSNREDVLLDFLNKHLPRRLTATLGGQVIGLDGAISGQIDILVTNDIGIRFEQNHKTFVTAECVASCISIKSQLNSEALTDCLNNLLSVPDPSPNCLDFPILKPGSFAEFLRRHPTYFIFAYDGMSGKNCIDALVNFFNSNKGIARNRLPHAVIVNKKYIITFSQTERTDKDGNAIAANQFHWADVDDNYRGFPLGSMISDISHYESWLNFMDISTHPYFNSSYLLQEPLI